MALFAHSTMSSREPGPSWSRLPLGIRERGAALSAAAAVTSLITRGVRRRLPDRAKDLPLGAGRRELRPAPGDQVWQCPLP